MPTLSIDERTVTVPEGATLLVAAAQIGVTIPTLCHRPELPSLPGCMVCAVCDESAGNRLVPACATLATEGMRIRTTAPAALELRRAMLELLLSNHAADCEAPCQLACPCHFDIPAMLAHLARGDADAARGVIVSHLALPVTLGFICPAPCEKACRRGVLDAPVAICAAKRLAGTDGTARGGAAAESGRRVLIVGGGPFGLAAAWHVRQHGHACHVMEATPVPGGVLLAQTAGRLPAEALAADLARLRTAGVTFETDSRVTPAAVPALLAAYDGVVLAAGTDSLPLAEALCAGVRQELVAADRVTHQTANPKLFTGGAAMQACRMAATACAHGRRVAAELDAWLRTGRPRGGEPARFRSRAGAIPRGQLAGWRTGADGARSLPPAGGVQPATLTRAVVQAEAARCLQCACARQEDCRLRELCTGLEVRAPGLSGTHTAPTREWIAPGVALEAAKCVLCGICVRTAARLAAVEPIRKPPLAIAAGPEAPPYHSNDGGREETRLRDVRSEKCEGGFLERRSIGPAFHGRGFEMRIAPPLGRSWADVPPEILAACVAACPTGAWAGRPAPRGGVA